MSETAQGGNRVRAAAKQFAAAQLRMPMLLLLLTFGLGGSITLSVMLGPVAIPADVAWLIVIQHIAPESVPISWEAFQATIVWDIRLPRALLAALVGAGLAVVGTAMQALVRNPLADPYLLGISSGASVGAVLVLLLGITIFGPYSLSIAAFLGALIAFLLVYLLAQQRGQLPTGRLILAGVAVSYVLSALTNFLVYRAEESEQARSAMFWLLGGLSGARWEQLPLPALGMLLCMIVLLAQGRTLNALLLGESVAASLGVQVQSFRLLLFILTSLLTGMLVAVSGGIGFVGLMLPHMVRLLIGTDHRKLLPVAALGGANFLIWVDLLARTLSAPQEMPVGIITALLGGPFFLWLLRRQSDKRTK